MPKKAVVIVGVLLLAGGLLWARRATAATSSPWPTIDASLLPWSSEPGEPPEIFDPGAQSFVSQIEDWAVQNIIESEYLTVSPPPLLNASSNISAMLETIKRAEGTAGRGDPYRVCYAYKHTINSFADHPALTGEWRGERLSDAMCAGAGLGPGCVSTAAGAYQIIKPTWLNLKAKLGLRDFSPASQDAACIELLRRRGAIAYLESGQFDKAVFAARKEWASLTGAGYGQGERSLAWLTDRFLENGGVLA